ncbi:MAG: cupin domain-containing protein [Actinomycetota bacterium]|nr:cupin domain-containing protein [Actinomycetota bacterium]
MKRIDVDAVLLERFGSRGLTIHHPTSGPGTLFTTTGPASMVIAVLDAAGVLGRHPAVGPQLLMVTAGSVQVAGGDGQWAQLETGDAVLFADGEEHETRATSAATVAILQWHADR